MEPAEAIVNAWLQMQGFFTMNNIRVDKSGSGKKPEIDILAVRINNKKKIEKWHVEVTVAVHPFGKWNKKFVKDNILPKFNEDCRVNWIKKYFGESEYEKKLVVSDKCLTPKAEQCLEDQGIKCYRFSEIISDLKDNMENKSYDDDTRRFLGLILEHEKFLKKKSKIKTKKEGKNVEKYRIIKKIGK